MASDDESTCWFCVGSGKAELELLVTIGEGLYMAVPKVNKWGWNLVDSPRPWCAVHSLNQPLTRIHGRNQGPVTPEHVLLIPIKHVPAMARLSPEEWAEFERYKGALRE